MRIEKFKTLEEGILLLQEEAKQKPLTIGSILQILSGKGRALLLILLSLPFCQPLQIPGLSLPFGLACAFVGLRMAFSKQVWLPQKILHKPITPKVFDKITSGALKLTRKMKPWIHPRLYWICHSPFMVILNGLTVFLLGVLLALPLPIPLSNLTAAWSIFLIALGTLEDDGLLVILGYLVTLITLIFFMGITWTVFHFV